MSAGVVLKNGWEMNGYSYGNLIACDDGSVEGTLLHAVRVNMAGMAGLAAISPIFPKENMTILMMMQKKDAGTF